MKKAIKLPVALIVIGIVLILIAYFILPMILPRPPAGYEDSSGLIPSFVGLFAMLLLIAGILLGVVRLVKRRP